MAKKGENIYKRKDKRWEARYIKGHNANGSAIYGYCYAKTYSDVKRKLTEAKANMLINPYETSPLKAKKFAYYCDEWLIMNRTRVKESTYVKYSTIIFKHIKPKLGSFMVESLSAKIIEQFSYGLLYNEGLAAKTVRDILTVLKSVLKQLTREYPHKLQSIEIIYPKMVKKEMRVLTRDEQEKLISYLLTDMDNYKFGVLLALLTGLRIGEVCALRWGDISIENKTIKVTSSMQRLHNFDIGDSKKTKILFSTPKSETSVRVIPLTDLVLSLCKLKIVENPDAFVLTGDSEAYVEPRNLQYRLKKYTCDCNLDDVHFHTLRHTFATRCVEVDFELKSLSEILGHSSPRITLERYVHSSLELKRSNMKKLSSIGF
jgi:integrase